MMIYKQGRSFPPLLRQIICWHFLSFFSYLKKEFQRFIHACMNLQQVNSQTVQQPLYFSSCVQVILWLCGISSYLGGLPKTMVLPYPNSNIYMFLFFSVGQSFLTLSPLQITSLAVISGRLWVGTGGGALFSIPLSISKFNLNSAGGFTIYCGLSSINCINDCVQHRRKFPSRIAPLGQPSCVTMGTGKLSGSS